MILGGGMTGLAAGIVSGLPVYEGATHPGGICSSYYLRPGTNEPLHCEPPNGEAYRFEIGGGHWIFGGDPAVAQFLRNRVNLQPYWRKSGVYLPGEGLHVPYPLQNHLRCLGGQRAAQVLHQICRTPGSYTTMKEWLREYFGEILCDLFFYPFHALYTAGLYDRIAPQDSYKSPVDIASVIEGAFGSSVASAGYNAQFFYPAEGLNVLAQRMAEKCDIRYGKCATRIDPHCRVVSFEDGSSVPYQQLICTLPLNKVMEMCEFAADCPPDPYSSVLVLNVGATRGPLCPDDHWLYFPDSSSGFHRVGFYSAVDTRFLPISSRYSQDRVSIYVERGFRGGAQPSACDTRAY